MAPRPAAAEAYPITARVQVARRVGAAQRRPEERPLAHGVRERAPELREGGLTATLTLMLREPIVHVLDVRGPSRWRRHLARRTHTQLFERAVAPLEELKEEQGHVAG